MHDLNLYLKILSLFFIAPFIFNGCGSSTNHEEKITTEPFTDFKNFPNKPFHCIDLGLSKIENIDLMKSNDYQYNEPSILIRESDSTAIIIGDFEDLTEFKIYLKSDYYLNQSSELLSQLSEKSTHHIGSESFSEMRFESIQNPFKLTYFLTEQYIRLSYTRLVQRH